MNARQQENEPIDSIMVDWFTKTLLPVFSWFLSRLFSAASGYKLKVVLLHPTATYRGKVADSWVKNYELFSCAEILSFERASGRRRGRKKLRKLLRPPLREMKRNKEFLLFKCLFQNKLNALKKTVDDKIPIEIVAKARIEIDIAKLEQTKGEPFTGYSSDDILSYFPIGSTLADGNLTKRIVSEVEDYPETMRSLLWEGSRDWSLIEQVREHIREDSEIWKILGVDSNDDSCLEGIIDSGLDFAAGQVNEYKVMYLSRWFMDRILVSQFIVYPYSEKRFYSLEKPIADGLTLGDTLASKEEENELPLSDQDRLSQFCELAGIDIGVLTAGDSSRLLSYLSALDAGFDFASKQGVSMKQYYGERADSEKTQRQRLFKKIKEASTRTQ